MNIFVDADSCPVKVREIITKASNRLSINCFFVANREIPIFSHDYVHTIITSSDSQSADNYIVDNISIGDLVITRDIPLANDLVDKNITVINDRGDIYTSENIKERLSIRDFMQEARELGLKTETTNRFSSKDIQKFANAFDKELTRLNK